MTEVPKYESYKDSGYQWIGVIPTNWEISKLGQCLTPVSEKNHPNLPLLSITRELGVIERDIYDQESNHNYIPDDLSGYKLLKKGQFGMNKMKAWQGSYGVSKYTGIVSPAYFVFDFSKAINPEFFHWAIRSKLYVSYFGCASDGVRIGQWDLSKTRMKDIPFILPEEKQQELIAKYLDKKVVEVDEAIFIKEQQVSLLKEQKQIIINRSVTQGISSGVQMKDSGVDWIGIIPEHWIVKRAKYIFDEVDERSRTGEEELLSVSHMTGVTPRSEKNVNMFMAEDYSGSKLCRENDLVVNIMWAWMGALGVSRQVGIVSPSYGVYRQKVKDTFNPVYLEYLLKSTKYVEYYNKVSTGLHSSRLRFYGHMLFAMKIGYPPIDEQNKIISHLEKQTSLIDETIKVQYDQIANLKDYKSSLINSAVTGKIKITPEMVEG